ncbi:HNH endonuclease [Novosphingobium fluoreni]|uniref:HNH endonuclease n=1 Tax=Novosphingobium fluoreni TaxID=1391222 RepID=UPI003DA01D50
MKRLNIARQLAVHVLHRAQGGLCAICGRAVNRMHEMVNFDHVWPKAMLPGVERTKGNVLLAHTSCNAAKGARRPTGCEIIMLAAVNRALGYNEQATARFDRRFA